MMRRDDFVVDPAAQIGLIVGRGLLNSPQRNTAGTMRQRIVVSPVVPALKEIYRRKDWQINTSNQKLEGLTPKFVLHSEIVLAYNPSNFSFFLIFLIYQLINW